MQGRTGPDHASRYAANAHDLESFARAELQLARLQTPLLVSDAAPDGRLYVAGFDGTGNNGLDPALTKTNVTLLYEQIEATGASHPSVQAGYVPGPGSQNRWLPRILDASTGHSYEARLEEMYLKFCRQAADWIRETPNARISLADVGFSRGAEQAAGFARMVHERGIRDPSGVQLHRDRDGLIDRIAYRTDLPPLRPPGTIAQAELLFDPVGAGEPSRHDRRPPPGVLTGLQIYAEDERRDLFPSSHIIDPGLSTDGRFLGVVVGGAHSNIGGGYAEDGLSRRSLNLGIDFLNSLSARPFLRKTWLRADLDVIVRSTEHVPFYDDDAYRANERAGRPLDQRRPGIECIDGHRRRCGPGGRDAEAVDARLDARFSRRPVPIGPVPTTPDEFRDRVPAQERGDLQPQAPPPGPVRLLLKPFADAGGHGADPLVTQAEGAVRNLERSLGRTFDASSERMAASLARLAKAEGFDRIDAVMLGRPTETVRAGEHVFVVQGRFPDATNRVAHMKTQDAIATPVEHSMRQMEQLDASRHALAGVPGQTQGPPLAHRLRA